MNLAIDVPIVQASVSQKINLLSMDKSGLESWLATMNEPRFRADQILKWVHQKKCFDFEQMTNLKQSLREKLSTTCAIKLPKMAREFKSSDGTIKWLFEPFETNNNLIETVYIPEDNRATLCISSQIGCILDCHFCHTGRQGFNRNLNAAEIIGQVLAAQIILEKNPTPLQPITNIVYMGMGEPLLNEKNVLISLNLLLDTHDFSKYRVTISTVGIIPAMRRLKTLSQASLALSLHAPNDSLREKLMPINQKYPLKDLLDVCKSYFDDQKRRKVTIEYIMIDQINDQPEHSKQLIKLLSTLPCKINLIPFNPFPGSSFKASKRENLMRFQKTMMNAGFITTIRKQRGNDIASACGQLAGMVQNKKTKFSKPLDQTARER